MIPESIITKLKDNWGDPAQSMSCKAFLRYYDWASRWQCFVLAINPLDSDEMTCIIQVGKAAPDLLDWKLSEIPKLYNGEGEPPRLDEEFRPILAAQLWKQLNEGS